jgi:hypothetical protein
MSQQVDRALVPVRDFVIGSTGLQTRRISLHNLSEPMRDGLTVESSLPAKVPSLSVPPDPRILSGQAASLRSPTRNRRVEKSPYMHGSTRTTTPPSIGLAHQTTLVDSFIQHDTCEQPKQDRTHSPPLQISRAPATVATVSLDQDCPRIDLVALVRDNRKAKKFQKKKPFVPLLREELHRRINPRGPGPQKSR